MAQRRCYGYDTGPDGELVINPDEAALVRWIFERYLSGNSLGKIAAGLEKQGIPSPTGKPKWNREPLNKLLSNGCAIIGPNQQTLAYQVVGLIWFTYGSKEKAEGDSRNSSYHAAGFVFAG